MQTQRPSLPPSATRQLQQEQEQHERKPGIRIKSRVQQTGMIHKSSTRSSAVAAALATTTTTGATPSLFPSPSPSTSSSPSPPTSSSSSSYSSFVPVFSPLCSSPSFTSSLTSSFLALTNNTTTIKARATLPRHQDPHDKEENTSSSSYQDSSCSTEASVTSAAPNASKEATFIIVTNAGGVLTRASGALAGVFSSLTEKPELPRRRRQFSAGRQYRQHHRRRSGFSLFLLTITLGLLFLVMTTRHTLATPAPAPAPISEPAPLPEPLPAPQASDPSPPAPPPSPPSAPTPSNPAPAEKQPAKTNDQPPPASSPTRVVPDVAPALQPPAPAPSSTAVAPTSPNAAPTPVTPIPPLSSSSLLIPATTATTTAHSSSSTNHHHHSSTTQEVPQQPSGTPYRVINSNDSTNRIMLTVSLAVVFVILAGMGLVVYCLFRRRSAKRRMHLFGSSGSKNISGGSLDSLAAAGEGGANGGKMKILNRRSSMRSLGGGGGNDAVATALAEMQEQQRRISDVDGTRITRRSSVLSLGGLRPLNHHHQHHHQQQQYPGSGVVSPTLGPTRPQSSYWNGNGGAGADAVGEEAGRTSMSGSIVIGSGDYVAGPLESSTEFRTTLYDDLYHPSRQFLYPSGNSSGANSHEQLLGPNHRHHHQQNYPYQYYGGSHSSTNMNRRSSLSPGSYPNPQEMSMVNGANGQRPSPAFRAKTISTGNGHGYQQQMHYPQHYSPQVGPAAGHRPPLVHSSTSPLPSSQKHQMSIAQPSTIASNSSSSTESPPHGPEVVGVGTGARASGDMARSSVPMADYSLDRDPRRTNSISMFQHDSSPYGHGHGDERARSPPLTSSSTGKLLDQRASYDRNSNLVIPPSITTRPRSLMPTNGGGTNNTQSMYGSSPAGSPGVGYPYQPQQQGYPQSGGYGQEYFPERASYESSSRQYHHHPSSGPGKPITPYGYPPHLEHQHHKGLGKTEVIEGAGVGTASSSGNTAAQGGGPKSPQSSSWPRRSNSGGPIVHMAPAPAPPVPSFRSSATAAAAGLTIVTPACGGLDLCKTEAAEVLNSPTDSTAQ